MALLATFTNAGNVSMINGPATAAGVFCLAHGLTTTPDVALAIHSGPSSVGGGITSIPIGLISRTATAAIFNSGTGSVGLSAEVFAQVVHSIMR